MTSPNERRRVVYAGRVQGVGFRATTRVLSQDFAVTGFVRNLPDGTVELEAEGAGASVQAFLDAIAAQFRGHIEHTEVVSIAATGADGSFNVRY